MLTKEVIQRIQSLYSKGVQSDDSRLTSRHIYSKIMNVRTNLLKQKANKKQTISQWNYQVIPCVKLVEAPAYECPCLPPVGCKILKTEVPIPQPITDLNRHLIQSVTSLTGDVVYSEITWNEKKYKSYSKYTGDKPDYFFRNNYLYVTHKEGPKIISITGLFEDPFEVDRFPSFCEPCYNGGCEDCTSPLDKEFPLDADMIDTLVEMTLNELVGVFSKSREDVTNNSKDSLDQESK